MAELAQSLIVTGAKGVNLRDYIDDLATEADQRIVIEDHPNPTKTSTGIYIEDIRDLQVAVRAARRGVRTIVVFDDAAKMTAQSQNALLKLLEEPRPGLHIVLCTSTPLLLLDTIRSRCQLVVYAPEVEVDLPNDKAARIRFMAGGVAAEASRLAADTRYYDRRVQVFEQAKRLVGGGAYERLVVVKQAGDKRDAAYELIDASLVMYRSLLMARFSPKLRDEAALLLDIDTQLRRNSNVKLQLLRFAVQ